MVPKCKKICDEYVTLWIVTLCQRYTRGVTRIAPPCVSYQLALNSYRNRYKLVLFYHQFIYFSEYIYIYLGPTQSRPKYFCVTTVSHSVTKMTHLVEFLRTRYYGSLVGAYFGLLSKFSSFCSLFYTVFNLSTKCVGGALCHDLCVRLVNKL